MSLGHSLHQLRVKHGWTQIQTAEKLSITQSLYSQIENNKVIPTEVVFNRLQALFEVTTDTLLRDVGYSTLQKKFSHIAVVKQQLAQQSVSPIVVNRFILAGSILLSIGTLLCLLGGFAVLKSNTTYYYCDTEYISIRTEDHCTRGTIMTLSSYQGKLYRHNSDIFYRELYAIKNNVAMENKLLITVGIILFAAGLFIILFERRLRDIFAKST